MNKKILAVFAHPDDESFGPGGTIAKYAKEGTEIHLLCATRGEAGQWDEKEKLKIKDQRSNTDGEMKVHHVREKELIESAKVLGVKKVEFLDYIDGTLCNAIYHELAGKIIKKIEEFQPQVILTIDRLGVSGHLDHIAVSMITTYSFLKTNIASKLYYHCLPKKWFNNRMVDYFIYFPDGYEEKVISTRIDYEKYKDLKVKAMMCHKSQQKDVDDLLKLNAMFPKIDHFILGQWRGITPKFPETDFFAGI